MERRERDRKRERKRKQGKEEEIKELKRMGVGIYPEEKHQRDMQGEERQNGGG